MARLNVESLDRRDLMSAGVLAEAFAGRAPMRIELENVQITSVTATGPETSPGTVGESRSLDLLTYSNQNSVRRPVAGGGVGMSITVPLGSTKGSLYGLLIEPEDVPS
jgi:hypothetical protein